MGGISKDMSESGMEKAQAAVRLRKPERRQVAMVVQCPDDLVSAVHPVRLVLAVVEKLDLSRFQEPIKARAGEAVRHATQSPLFAAMGHYLCLRGRDPAPAVARGGAARAALPWRGGGGGGEHPVTAA